MKTITGQMKAAVAVFSLLLISCWQKDDPEISKLFKQNAIEGAMIIVSQDGTTKLLYNTSRLKTGYIPASTFKIVNTLIGLEEGVITASTKFKWDGVKRPIEVWNQDQTLKSAFQNSCVWCYQSIAVKVGLEKYKKHLVKLKYGNQNPASNVKTFWLEGDLRISAIQQIDLLKRVKTYDLPYTKKNIDILKDIMLEKESANYKLRSKTGFSQNVGWYVGYLTTKRDTWFFATNLRIEKPGDLKNRKRLTISALKLKRFIQ